MASPPAGLLLGRPFGVPIYISASWLLFVAFITVQFAPVVGTRSRGSATARFVVAAAFGVFLGVSVLAHEVAHCVVARRFGIPIERISLSFLAGHSALAREPETPARSAAVAVAGPATNLVIGAGAFFAYRQLPDWRASARCSPPGSSYSNLLVGVYNLLPGLPLDGGQLLRAALWRITRNPRTGTVGAAWAGRVIAGCTAALGLFLVSTRRTDAAVQCAVGDAHRGDAVGQLDPGSPPAVVARSAARHLRESSQPQFDLGAGRPAPR